MPRHARRSATPLTVASVAVFLCGVLTAAATERPPAPRPAQTAVAAAVVAPVPVVAPVSLAVEAPAPPVYDPGDPATWSSAQLAAQLVFSCVHTSTLGTAVEHAAAGVGGVALLGHPTDAGALAATLAAVRAAGPSGIAPLLASDEEGGLVQRLDRVLGELPSAQEMGSWPDERIGQVAHDYGTRMRQLGFSMVLSPVADLDAPGFYVSGTRRAFSADPGRVSSAAVAWSRGFETAGVASAVKHWPGHGYATDSHGTAPDVPPLPVLAGRDLLPFDAVTRSGGSVVMVGHLRSEGLTEPGVPATLSPNALRVLRERVGPGTVVLTDSLSMAASSAALGIRPADAVVRALQAGADWAMSCVDPLAGVDAVRGALDSGALRRDTAVAAARRVLGLKQRLGLLAVPVTPPRAAGALEGASVAHGFVTLTGWAGAPWVEVLAGDAVVQRTAVGPSGRFALAVPTGGRICLRLTGAGPAVPLGCVATPA